MKLLLDACSFLCAARGDALLSAEVAALFRVPAIDVCLSAVSAWEIAVRHRYPEPVAW